MFEKQSGAARDKRRWQIFCQFRIRRRPRESVALIKLEIGHIK